VCRLRRPVRRFFRCGVPTDTDSTCIAAARLPVRPETVVEERVESATDALGETRSQQFRARQASRQPPERERNARALIPKWLSGRVRVVERATLSALVFGRCVADLGGSPPWALGRVLRVGARAPGVSLRETVLALQLGSPWEPFPS
jgi:hypothetical protein